MQAKTQNTAEFNAETEKSALQAKSDALQARIDALQESSDKVVSAVNATTGAVVASGQQITDAINNQKPGTQGGGEFVGPDGSSKRNAFPLKITPENIQSYIDKYDPKGEYVPGVKGSGGNAKISPSDLDPKRAWEDNASKDALEEYVRRVLASKISQLVNPEDGIVISLEGSDRKLYKFKVQKNGEFVRMGTPETQMRRASGGVIRGAGTGTSDSIPAYLSNGEYVIRAASVKKYGVEAMDALNAGKFATGGQVGRSASSYIPRLNDGGLIPEYRLGGLVGKLGGKLFSGIENLVSKLFVGKQAGKAIKPNKVEKFLSDTLGDVSLPKIKKEELPAGVGGQYIPRFSDKSSNYENLLPHILFNSKYKVQGNTAVHETMHHFDMDVLHDSFRRTIAKLRVDGKTDLADEYESLFVTAENKQKGMGLAAWEDHAITLQDYDSLTYFGGAAEAFADESTFKAYSKFMSSPKIKDKKLALKIGNPYGPGYGDLRGYFSSYAQFEKNALNMPMRLNPSFLRGLVENSPNMPQATKDVYLGWAEGLQRFKPPARTNPDEIQNSLQWQNFKKYITDNGLDKAKGLRNGGLVPGYRFGGLAGRLFGGLSKLASKIIPEGFINKLSKNPKSRTQPNTGSVDLPTPTIIDPVKPPTPTIIDPIKPPATKIAMPTNPDAPITEADIQAIKAYTREPRKNTEEMAFVLSKVMFGEDSGTFYRALSNHDMAILAGYTRIPNPRLQNFNPEVRLREASKDTTGISHYWTDKTLDSPWSGFSVDPSLQSPTQSDPRFFRYISDWKDGVLDRYKAGEITLPQKDSEAALPFLDVYPGLKVGDWWRPDLVKSITKELDFAKYFAVTGRSSGGGNLAIAKIIVEPNVRGLADFRSVIPTHQASNYPPVPEYTEGAIAPYTKYVLEAINKNAHRFTDDEKGVSHLIDEYVLKAVDTAPYNPFLAKILNPDPFWLKRLPIVKKAQGGMIRGTGTPTSDSIPAYLSNGEYVIKADSVKKYGVGALDELNAGKFANGGLMQRFKNGIPAFGSGGSAKWLTRFKSMGKFAISGGLYKLMEDGERWLTLKHGANENSSGFHKWSKAIGRALYNVPQGAVSGLPFAKAGFLGGAIFGGLEGLEGLRRDGSQYGVKGGSRSTEKGFSPKEELYNISLQQSAADALKAAGVSAFLGPILNLLPKGIKNAITTKLGKNIVSSALISMAPFNPTMGIGLPVRPTTAVTNKYVGSALENKIITGVAAQTNAGSRTFAGSINTIENQIPVARTSDDVSKSLVDDMFASAMSLANASGRYAPNFLGRNMEAREGPAQFATFEEIDPFLDDVTKWPWESSKPSESPVIKIPTIVDKLSLKQRRMIAYLAGKKSSLVGVPSVTQKELNSGYNWYYKQYGNEALDWDKFKEQKLASVGLSSPAHKRFTGYVTNTGAFETLHENDRMTPNPGQNPGTTSRKFSVGQQRQSDEFEKIYGTSNSIRYETPLMDDSDYGVALRQKFGKVYDELIRRGYIRKAWYDAKGKRHEQKDTAPLPGSPFVISSPDALHGPFTPDYRGKALTRYEFYKAITESLPGGFTSSRQASNYSDGAINYLDRPTHFTSLINQIYAEQHGLAPGEKIKFWKYDLYGSPLKNKDGDPVAAGYYTLDKGMAYAYARGRTSNVTQEELDAGSSRIIGATGADQASSRGAYSIDLYPHEVPQVLGLGGLKDEMGIVIGETLAKSKSKFTGMAKADEYKYEVDPGAIRGLSPWKMYAPGDPWTVESPKAVFGVSTADSAKMANLLNTEQLSLRVGGKKDWSDASVSQVLKDAKPYISMDGTSRFVAQDAIPRYWGSDAEEILERMLKAQEMYNLIRVHIQNLPKVELLKTLSKPIARPGTRFPGFATGGLIKGPGTGISDSIQAGFGYAGGGSIRVSNGEYVVKASSVRDYGVKTMDAINNGTATVGANSSGTVYNINMPVTSNNANPEIVANEVMRKLKLEISKNNKTNRVGG